MRNAAIIADPGIDELTARLASLADPIKSALLLSSDLQALAHSIGGIVIELNDEKRYKGGVLVAQDAKYTLGGRGGVK